MESTLEKMVQPRDEQKTELTESKLNNRTEALTER